jgi:ubiquinone/menaquinone biosynthesis C-methylase UbiE
VTMPDNPFAASEVGALYQRGRPYHHRRTLARLRALMATANGGTDVEIDRAIDVACGTGLSTLGLAEFARTVVGFDISPEMMRVALSASNIGPSNIGASNIRYVLGRAEQLGFAGGVFDAVTCSSGIHWFDQQRFFAELRRVVRAGGWIGLYDHYFMGMPDVDGFDAWVAELFVRYPLPPRNPQVGDPRSQTPDGFEVVGTDTFEDPIEMTHEAFVDYQITVSSCVAAAERGIPQAEIRNWLLESSAPLFDTPAPGTSTRSVTFDGAITCLRRLP